MCRRGIAFSAFPAVQRRAVTPEACCDLCPILQEAARLAWLKTWSRIEPFYVEGAPLYGVVTVAAHCIPQGHNIAEKSVSPRIDDRFAPDAMRAWHALQLQYPVEIRL